MNERREWQTLKLKGLDGSITGKGPTHSWGRKSFAGIPNWLWAAVVTTVILIGIYAFFECQLWRWLRGGVAEESRGDTLRNLMLILAAVIGLPLAIWRSTTAHKQANVAQKQANVAQKQANVAQKGLQNERYQRGAEMLGSDTLVTRIGGIYALERLAREHQREYHIQIMDLFCAIVRYPKIRTSDVENGMHTQEKTDYLPPDVQEALTVIGRRNQEQRKLENEKSWQIHFFQAHLENALLQGAHLEDALLGDAHLEGAYLVGAHLENAILLETHLEDANLSGAHLENAGLLHAYMENANLSGAYLENAGLVYANLENANLSDAHFEGVELSYANLKDVVGLTQAMLDSAAHFDDNGKLLPGPNLAGAFCAESGEPLVWRVPPDFSSSSGHGESNC